MNQLYVYADSMIVWFSIFSLVYVELSLIKDRIRRDDDTKDSLDWSMSKMLWQPANIFWIAKFFFDPNEEIQSSYDSAFPRYYYLYLALI